MNNTQAETIGIQALGWLANDPDLLGQFLNTTGASADDLRAQANQPEFLASVLDFLMLSDDNVLGFSRNATIEPEQVVRAQFVLSGGGVRDWT